MNWPLRVLLSLLPLFAVAAAQQEPAACTTEPVQTTTGLLCGLTVQRHGNAVRQWLGIPYATPPVGELRWQPTVALAPWQGTLEATSVGSICPQTPNPLRIEGAAEAAEQSEDCLTLNIWAPAFAADELLPVLVYIHGGAFTHGSSTDSPMPGSDWYLQDGSFLAAGGRALVVSFNYRLGALGFLANAGATGLEGNFGFRDQLVALQWLRENLEAFGGDPQRVTLAGESAGAMSVGLHLLATESRSNYFQAAIMQSNPLGVSFRTLEQTRSSGDAFLLSTGCLIRFSQLDCLRNLSVEEILDSQENWSLALDVLDEGLQGILPWAPVVDGNLITGQPLELALRYGSPKPLLIGHTAEEGLLFVSFALAEPVSTVVQQALVDVLFGSDVAGGIRDSYPADPEGDTRETLAHIVDDAVFICPALALASATRPVPAFVYEFSHPPGFDLDLNIKPCSGRSCHATELSFVFGTAGIATGFSSEEAELARQMGAYWLSFTAGGGGADTMDPWPVWTDSQRERFDFAIPNAINRAEGHNCDLWREWLERL